MNGNRRLLMACCLMLSKEAAAGNPPDLDWILYLKSALRKSAPLRWSGRSSSPTAQDFYKTRVEELKKQFLAEGHNPLVQDAPPPHVSPDIEGYWRKYFRKTD